MESGIGQFIPLIVIIIIVVVVLKLKNKGRETRIKEFNKKHGTNFKNELELNYFIATKLDKKAEGITPEKKEIVEPGTTGEIGVSGSGVLKGYLNDSDAFQESMHQGYFMTGDLGYVDDDGSFHYEDRKKDLIIKAGINISPSQIDAQLQTHPSVKEAATVGEPDPYLGETIKSFIILKENSSVDKKELLLFCKAELGDFKTPSKIQFVESLPKGPSGKILKRKLRENNQKGRS